MRLPCRTSTDDRYFGDDYQVLSRSLPPRTPRTAYRCACAPCLPPPHATAACQALPKRGYTRIFENMLLDNPAVTIRLGVDFFQARD